MGNIKAEQIKVLSDPNRLAMLSLLSMKEMTMSQISKMLDLSVQNTLYHIKKLLESDLIRQTRSEVVGNLVEKYYRSTFEPGIISEATDEATVDIAERVDLVFAAMGAIKGVLNRGITILDGRRDYFMRTKERPRYPFGANYIILPNTAESAREAEELVGEIDRRMQTLAEKYADEGNEKFALAYALFPYD